MNHLVPMLAQSGTDFGATVSDEARNRILLFITYATVILAVVAWAVFIRKQQGKRRRIRKHRPAPAADEPVRRRRRRRRQRHPAKLPQNPSLAEARGLPPRRPEDVPPAGA